MNTNKIQISKQVSRCGGIPSIIRVNLCLSVANLFLDLFVFIRVHSWLQI